MAGARGTRTGTKAADCADMRNNTTISGAISGLCDVIIDVLCFEAVAKEGLGGGKQK